MNVVKYSKMVVHCQRRWKRKNTLGCLQKACLLSLHIGLVNVIMHYSSCLLFIFLVKTSLTGTRHLGCPGMILGWWFMGRLQEILHDISFRGGTLQRYWICSWLSYGVSEIVYGLNRDYFEFELTSQLLKKHILYSLSMCSMNVIRTNYIHHVVIIMWPTS